MKASRIRDHAAAIRTAVADLVDQSERLRKQNGQLRLAGLALIKYLERLASGKTVGAMQAEEISAAIKVIRDAR